MIGGSILVGAGVLMFGWTSELVGLISEQATVWTLRYSIHDPREDLGIKARFDIMPCPTQKWRITTVVAVLSTYLVDFAANTGIEVLPTNLTQSKRAVKVWL
jgi:hypothetical protein